SRESSSGKATARLQHKVEQALERARKALEEGTRATREEFERARKAAEAQIRSEASRETHASRLRMLSPRGVPERCASGLEATSREFEKEAASLSNDLADFVKRTEQSRAIVQRDSTSAKHACKSLLECAASSQRNIPLASPLNHQKSCAATVQKAIRKVGHIQQRRLPWEDLIKQVTSMTEILEKDLCQA
ncbi:MAG: hypothetical protein SGPRY_007722, partial [Prymnesium sp.]